MPIRKAYLILTPRLTRRRPKPATRCHVRLKKLKSAVPCLSDSVGSSFNHDALTADRHCDAASPVQKHSRAFVIGAHDTGLPQLPWGKRITESLSLAALGRHERNGRLVLAARPTKALDHVPVIRYAFRIGIRSVLSVLLSLMSGAALGEPALDFASFVDLVERNHPEAAVSQLSVERARLAGERAGVLPDPEVAISRENLPLKGKTDMDASAMSPMFQLTLSQSLPWPGTLNAAAAASRAASEGAGTEEKMAALLRRLDAKNLFVDMVRLAEAVDFQKASVEDADSILSSAAARIRNGIGSHHELVQAQNEKAVHSLNLAALEADLENLKDHAAQLIGRDDATGLAFTLRLPDDYTGVKSPGKPTAESPGVDLIRLRQQQGQDEAAARLTTERKQSLPHFMISGMMMRQDDGMRSVGAMAGISVPVFSGQIRRSVDDESGVLSTQSSRDLGWHDRKKMLAETQNQRRVKVLSQSLQTLHDEIVRNAKGHLQAVALDYALGRTSFAAVNAAREQLLQYELAEASARQNLARAMISREKILAGFVDDAIDRPTPQVSTGDMNGGGEMEGRGMAPSSAKGSTSERRSPPKESGRGGVMMPQTEEPSAKSDGMGGM